MYRLLKLAFRNLTRNRRRTILSVLAIGVGIGAMLFFRGMQNGQRQVLLSGLIDGQTGAIQVHKRGYVANVQGLPLTFDFADTPELRQKISAVPGVIAVAPRIAFGGMLSTPDQATEAGKTTFFISAAIDPVLERRVTPARFGWLAGGRMFEKLEAGEVVLNTEFAHSVGLQPLQPGQPPPPVEQMAALLAADRDGALNGENVVLVGLQSFPMPGDRRMGMVPLGTAQRLLRMEGRVTEYAVALPRSADVNAVRDQIAAAVGPDYEVHTWEQLMPFVRELMGAQDFLLNLVGTIFVIVVLLGIVNSMLMNVLERVREIGTMLAVGMRRRKVVTLLVFEGTALGIAGGIVGVLLGAAVTWALHERGIRINVPGGTVENTLRPYITLPLAAMGFAAAVVGASLAALWPAYRASLLRPVDALRST